MVSNMILLYKTMLSNRLPYFMEFSCSLLLLNCKYNSIYNSTSQEENKQIKNERGATLN